METPLLSRLLLMMENLYVVATLSLIAIGIRVLWVNSRKNKPMPMVPATVRDPGLERLNHIVTAVVAVFALLLFGFDNPTYGAVLGFNSPLFNLLFGYHAHLNTLVIRVVLLVGIYVVANEVAHGQWKKYRMQHPLPEEKKENGKAKSKPMVRAKDITLEIIDTLIIALVLVFGIVRPFFLQTFFIPSGSMQPTLLGPEKSTKEHTLSADQEHEGDKLIANKFVFRFREPHKGEVIVFEPPVEAYEGNNPAYQFRRWLDDDANANTLTGQESSVLALYFLYPVMKDNLRAISATDARQNIALLRAYLPRVPAIRDAYIKRIVATAGDTVRVINGKGVEINGKLMPDTFLPQDAPRASMNFPVAISPPDDQPHLDISQFQRYPDNTANGYYQSFVYWLRDWYAHKHLYQARITPHLEQKGGETVFKVPAGTIFVMGDNRTLTGSFDSRYWGVVPLQNVKARAVSTFWPLNRLKLL